MSRRVIEGVQRRCEQSDPTANGAERLQMAQSEENLQASFRAWPRTTSVKANDGKITIPGSVVVARQNPQPDGRRFTNSISTERSLATVGHH